MPRAPRRQRQLPVSPDEILPKAVVRLLFNWTKAGRLSGVDSFFFDQSGYAALSFGWYPVVIRVHENSGNQYDFLVVSFMLLSDGRFDDR